MMVSATDPAHLTADQRLDEIAGILAMGIARLVQKRADKSERKENIPLDKSATKSVHVVANH